jgi:hypothetical protein
MQLTTASSAIKTQLSSSIARPITRAPRIARAHYGVPQAVSGRSQSSLATAFHDPTPTSFVGTTLQGRSGRNYVVEQVLQDRQNRFVYLAEYVYPPSRHVSMVEGMSNLNTK